ncbi:voltage-dependent calcium channel subunit alpha-2/delta-4 [Anopheles cruzii]|uniref:voltage-dependent calcium channel subunit alpha-2/delta-4 n=1 Tax=Anopheles cruzii TaxID=68878 RepID=UPI0022EC5B10|nr:voltage-dependent calcium channel subunit alpha-2/delta-4 [Anopheles cruzii]
MDMSWYKRAVDLYATEPEGFVFSVPFNSGYSGKNSSTLVTASHAIFIDHRGHRAPAAVVGLQFLHESLFKHFINITSKCTASTTCKKNCASDELDCYLLDDNGFVILSERSEHTGKFFGQIDGTIMDSLVQDRIYRRLGLMDYQGICSDRDNPYTGASEPLKPARPMSWLLQYFVSFATYWLSVLPTPIGAWQNPNNYYGEDTDGEEDDTYDYEQTDYELPPEHGDVTTPDYEQRSTPTPQRSHAQAGPRVAPDPAHARPCDLKTDLYVLQPDRLNSSGQNNPLKGKLTNCHSSGCERPFSVQKIPNSNLILLVVDVLCPCGSKQLDIEPQEVVGGAGACGVRRMAKEKMLRKRPGKCISYHPEETEIKQCGTATSLFRASLYSTIATFCVIWRIMDSAEQAALSESDPESAASKSHTGGGFYDARRINEYQSDGRLAEGSRQMLLRHMRRFEGYPVNISLSSVLLPVGVGLDEPETQAAIKWSSHLDPLFANNIERDSALSWQYFGSSTGFLRRFPGTAWPPETSYGSKEINDFRSADWFIQAASSPKDVVILLDSSGSMNGKEYQLAVATASAILDTLGDDDFFNLISFADQARVIVPCFQDKMVRATPDNVKEVKTAINAVDCENTANFSAALESAFELLRKYNQSSQGAQCNQAIMLITDGPSDTFLDVIKHYNHPHMPVRIFTYLIGTDKSGGKNLYRMACENKGFFVQVNGAEEARKKVVEYALVMARPMVLYQADHPVHWSPVFTGGRSGVLGRESENRRKLVTTVSTPVFDRRNHSVRAANLLGVVGTDVPIEEIQKMIPQHKLGVNGYSFIVDNNGRVLYHPDLRPMSDGDQYSATLKHRYNSVDLTEVELPEVDSPGFGNTERHDQRFANTLQELRNEMVMQKEGENELTVLAHLDSMKRVSLRFQKYFYGPIDGTPFSLGIALPDSYGVHELNAQQEIRHSHINVTEHFKGSNWKVHPDWVYCEYNSLKDEENGSEGAPDLSTYRDKDESFDTPEEQVLHFLARVGRPGWKWMSVRPRSPQPHHSHGGIPVGHYAQHHFNSQGSRKAEPYYCDRTLVQSLVRDAIVTDGLDRAPSHPARKEDRSPIATLMALLHSRLGFSMFSVKTTFVATRSGLLRWIDHLPHSEDSSEP